MSKNKQLKKKQTGSKVDTNCGIVNSIVCLSNMNPPCTPYERFVFVRRELKIGDGDGSENIIYKENSRSFKLHRDNSNLLYFLILGEFSCRQILIFRFQFHWKRESKIRRRRFTSSFKCEIRQFHVLVRVQWWQRNVPKSMMQVQSYCFVY